MQNLQSFQNKNFNRGASKLKELLWMLCSALFFQHSLALLNGFKITLLRTFGASVGKGVLIKPRVQIKFPWKLKIGNHVWIGEGVWIDNLAEVTIEDNVCISQGAYLLTGNHNYKKTSFDLITSPILLKESAWIGAKTTVCPGVTVHTGAILTVGSIATKDLEANGIYKGNPALKVGNRLYNSG
ncbi:MAG: WcaF family extracellular polysaccharide biosynthesis acetyltransferase [Bacteroidota bacterium]